MWLHYNVCIFLFQIYFIPTHSFPYILRTVLLKSGFLYLCNISTHYNTMICPFSVLTHWDWENNLSNFWGNDPFLKITLQSIGFFLCELDFVPMKRNSPSDVAFHWYIISPGIWKMALFSPSKTSVWKDKFAPERITTANKFPWKGPGPLSFLRQEHTHSTSWNREEMFKNGTWEQSLLT